MSVRLGNDESHIVLISNTGNACRFKPSEIKMRRDNNTGEMVPHQVLKTYGRNTQPKVGMKLVKDVVDKEGKKTFDDQGEKITQSMGHVVGMIVSDNEDTLVLTITKFGKAKRTKLGSGMMISKLGYDESGNPIRNPETQEVETIRDGFAKASGTGTQGSKAMGLRKEGVPAGVSSIKWLKEMTDKEKIAWHNNKFPGNQLKSVSKIEKMWPKDEIIRVHQIPNDRDQIFLLAASGMIIRFKAYNEDKETRREVGKQASGNWVMRVRDKQNGGFSDQVISSARLPAELIEDETPSTAENEEE